MNSKIIITDIDECVLQWRESFIEFIKDKNISLNGNIDDHKELDDWVDVSSDDFIELLYEFNNSIKFGDLNVGYKSDIFIPLLHEKGYKFYALTSCGSSDNIICNRIENIKRIFGDIFEEIICIELGKSKDENLKLLPHDCVWVEDKFSNSELGLKYGHACFLIHHDYNSHHENDDIVRVKDWEEIYSILN